MNKDNITTQSQLYLALLEAIQKEEERLIKEDKEDKEKLAELK